jgi:hypothetical protein
MTPLLNALLNARNAGALFLDETNSAARTLLKQMELAQCDTSRHDEDLLLWAARHLVAAGQGEGALLVRRLAKEVVDSAFTEEERHEPD